MQDIKLWYYHSKWPPLVHTHLHWMGAGEATAVSTACCPGWHVFCCTLSSLKSDHNLQSKRLRSGLRDCQIYVMFDLWTSTESCSWNVQSFLWNKLFERLHIPLQNISNINFYRYFNTLCTEMQISETVITKRPLLKWLMSSLDPIDSLKCFSRIVSIAPCHFGGCRSSRWWKNYRWKGLFGGYLCHVLTTDILIVYCQNKALAFCFLIFIRGGVETLCSWLYIRIPRSCLVSCSMDLLDTLIFFCIFLSLQNFMFLERVSQNSIVHCFDSMWSSQFGDRLIMFCPYFCNVCSDSVIL